MANSGSPKHSSARSRFIFRAVVGYVAGALLWIYFSDQLLHGATDTSAMARASILKGEIFVLVTAVLLYATLKAVPGQKPSIASATFMGGLVPGSRARGWGKWGPYAFALALVGGTVLLRLALEPAVDNRPMPILFVLPIIVSALIGGLGPGMLATLFSVILGALLFIPPLGSLEVEAASDRLLLAILLLIGFVTSLLSEGLRRSKAAAETHRQLLDGVLSGTQDAIFVKDRDGRYRFCNEATARILGREFEDILGQDDSFLMPPESAGLVKEHDAGVMASGQSSVHEEILTLLPGKSYICHVNKGPVFGPDGKVIGMFGIARDITQRKQAEAALRLSEQRLRIAMEVGMTVTFSMDRDLRYTWAHSCQIGFRDQDLVGKTEFDLFARESAEMLAALYRQVIRTDQGIRRDVTVRSLALDVDQCFDLAVEPWREGDGEITGIVCAASDITRRKASEQELRQHRDHLETLVAERTAQLEQSQQDLKSILDHVPSMIGYWTRDLTNRFANRAYGEWFGVDPAEMAGRHCRHALGEEHYLLNLPYSKLVLLGARQQFERTIVAPGGRVRHALAEYIPDICDGEVQGFYVLVTDITRIKEAEIALRNSEEQYRLLVNTTQEGILHIDRDGHVVFANDAMACLLGYELPERLLGRSYKRFFAFSDGFCRNIKKIDSLRRETLRACEFLVRRKDGREVWCLVSSSPIEGNDGGEAGSILFFTDFNDRKLMEAKLLAANKELESFTYAASHDLKGPLSRIAIFADMLQQKYRSRLDDEVLSIVEFIRGNARRMTTLVDDLLEHARIEQQLTSAPVQPEVAIGGVLFDKREDILEIGAEITVDLPETPVLADPQGLIQVMRNLIENALKYSRTANPPRIEIGGVVENGHYRLWVRDNGIGFSMAYHDQIFQIFRRLHSYDEIPGSGVGLALVQKAMERMGGRVWARSSPGQGATFFLEFLVASEQEPEAPSRHGVSSLDRA